MYRQDLHFPVAEDIAARGISLPSFPALTEDELGRVCEALKAALQMQGKV
jgi:perosamine synthetase